MRYTFGDHVPQTHETVWEAPSAALIGNVSVGANSTIWFGAVLRGDSGPIRIGEGTSVQDNVSMHGTTTVGDRCTIGHNAVVHGCTVGNGVLIGMGAVVLDRAVIGDGAIIAGGAVVAPRTVVPPGALMMGVPAQEVRRASDEEILQRVQTGGQNYIDLSFKYRDGVTVRPVE